MSWDSTSICVWVDDCHSSLQNENSDPADGQLAKRRRFDSSPGAQAGRKALMDSTAQGNKRRERGVSRRGRVAVRRRRMTLSGMRQAEHTEEETHRVQCDVDETPRPPKRWVGRLVSHLQNDRARLVTHQATVIAPSVPASAIPRGR